MSHSLIAPAALLRTRGSYIEPCADGADFLRLIRRRRISHFLSARFCLFAALECLPSLGIRREISLIAAVYIYAIR